MIICRIKSLFLLLFFTCLAMGILPVATSAKTLLLAPGYGELTYKLSKAGSYKLPALGIAKDAEVLDVNGKKVHLYDYLKGKYTLLSFMYTHCTDVNGCPLTHLVYSKLQYDASVDKKIAGKFQLVSISFDPKYDTPKRLKHISEQGMQDMHHMHHDQMKNSKTGVDLSATKWFYFTTASNKMLKPVLDAYNQSVVVQKDDKGNRTFSHILRVFLIDPNLKIRSIYTVSFIHPDVVMDDLKTIMMANKDYKLDEVSIKAKKKVQPLSIFLGSGDRKQGYESKNYVTDSVSLVNRVGKPTNLLKFVKNPPLGLPKVPIPKDNKLTFEKVKLGEQLFFDRRLSLNNTISCAMCHIPEQGFTNNETKTPVGIRGLTVRRNAPTIYNAVYYKRFFQDARETSLEYQVWQPIMAHREMGMPAFGLVLERLKAIPEYASQFKKVFNSDDITPSMVSKAIASYERTLVSGNSKFDRWYFGHEKNAMSQTAINGFKLFTGKAHCIACHSINKHSALFTDNKLHNTGIGWARSMGKEPNTESVLLAPGVTYKIPQSTITSVSDKALADVGYYEITLNPADRWRYRTPILRNVAITAPYMHDGSLATLEDVVRFYNKGGYKNPGQSPLIKPLNLSNTELKELVAFLKSLTGDNVKEIVSDAFSVPVGDVNN